MEKLRQYLAISLIWYQKAENWAELAEIESNYAQKVEYNSMAIQAAHKGRQFEDKAREELKNVA